MEAAATSQEQKWKLPGSRDVAEQLPRLSQPPDQSVAHAAHRCAHTSWCWLGKDPKQSQNNSEALAGTCIDVGAQMLFLPVSAVKALAGMEAS